jgi:hypothetical protein
VSTQEIVCAVSPPSPQFLRPSTDRHAAEQEHGKSSLMSRHFMQEASSLRNALRTLSIID